MYFRQYQRNIMLNLAVVVILALQSTCDAWNITIPYHVPNLDPAAAEATLSHVQNTISVISNNLQSLSNQLSTEQAYALQSLAVEGTTISTLVASIQALNREYSLTMGDVYMAQDELNALQTTAACYQRVNCTVTAAPTTSTSTTPISTTSATSAPSTPSTPYDYCKNNINPCINGGTCFSTSNNTYYCQCAPPYISSNCASVQCNALNYIAQGAVQSITSPGNAIQAIVGSNCHYTIRSSESNQLISLNISASLTGSCFTNYISIQAGDPPTNLAWLCAGNSSFQSYIQNNSPVMIAFVTSNTNPGGYFSGSFSQSPCDPCVEHNPCQNGGNCLSNDCLAQCDCSALGHFTGPYCNINTCSSNPCEGFPDFLCNGNQDLSKPCKFDNSTCTNPMCNCQLGFCGDYCDSTC